MIDVEAGERIRTARKTVSELRSAIAEQLEVLGDRRSTVRRELRQSERHEREILGRLEG